MSGVFWTFEELMELSGKTRRQIDYTLGKMDVKIRPKRIGRFYLFSAEEVRIILDELKQIRQPSKCSA